MAISKMPQAQAAYTQAMSSLAAAHLQLDAISSAQPVDWAAYDAALQSCNALQQTAQDALGVFEATILDTPAVADLCTKLIADTQSMKDRTAALSSAADTLNGLAAAATDADGLLTTIARYV